MKRIGFLCIAMAFLIVSCAGMTGGVQKKSVNSASIEKVEYKPDAKGNYYIYVTIKNTTDKDRPFYLLLQADQGVDRVTASGKRGMPNPVPAGKLYTFQVNTWKKEKPKKVNIEVLESLR